MKHVAKVRLPKCWKTLVDMAFPQDLKGILSEKTAHTGVADPKPHYDDVRRVEGRFPNGAEFTLELCSGQANYFGGLSVLKRGRWINSEVLESFNDLTVEDGNDTYEVEVDWVKNEAWTPA
jgi:hypothetical protein